MRLSVPTLSSSSPYWGGVAQGQNIAESGINNALKQQQQRIQNQYSPQKLQEAIRQQQLANQSQQQKNQVQPDSLQANLQQTLLANEMTRQKTKQMPLQSLIAAQNSLTSQGKLGQSKSRFGTPGYQLKQLLSSMPKATSAALQAKYPGIMRTLAEQQMNLALQGQAQGQPQAQVPQQPSGDLSSSIVSQLQDLGYASQQPQQAAEQQVQKAPQPTAEDIRQSLESQQNLADPTTKLMEKSNLISSNKASTGSDIQQRFDASRAFEGLVNNPHVTSLMGDVAKYQGLLGKSKEWYDKNMSPAEYNKVQGFRQQLGTFLAGNITKLEALGKNNVPLEKAYSFFELAQKSLKHDPDSAIGYMNQGLQLANDEYKSIAEAAQPLGDAYGASESKPAHIESQSSEAVQVIKPDGSRGTVPSDRLDEALNAGFRRAS